MKDLEIRRADAADLPAIARADERGFGFTYTDQDLTDLGLVIDPTRFLLATLPDAGIVGLTGSYDQTITPPGGAPLPAEGVTWVSVSMLHRRRGVLRRLMDEQLRGFVDAGVPVAILTASEGGIYGRFGYGVASARRRTEIDLRTVRFHDGVPDPGGVRWAGGDEIRTHAPEVHHRWCATHPGAVGRNPGYWEHWLLDREHHRGGASARFVLLHADGYLSFRIREGDRTCRVEDLFAVTPEAHIALWRAVLGRDLVDTVQTQTLTGDDPLRHLLVDPRAVRTVGHLDEVWARILDVPTVLAARRYAVDVDVVLEVADPVLDRGGRFRVQGGPGGASCASVDTAPDVRVGIAALGSLAFGRERARTLARAGLLSADEAVLGRVDAAFAPEREPRGGTEF